MRNAWQAGLATLFVSTVTLGCADRHREPPRTAGVADPAALTIPDPSTTSEGPTPRMADPSPAELDPVLPPSALGEERGAVSSRGDLRGERAAKTVRPLSDGEAVAVLVAANDGEVQMAEVAAKKADSAEVKQFAGMLRTHHTSGLQKTKALETRTKIASAESDASTQLKAEVEAILVGFQGKRGAAFDRAYVEAQVTTHQHVLAVLDQRLSGAGTRGREPMNGELNALVSETRRLVSDHLAKAEEIQKNLQARSARVERFDQREVHGR